MAQFEPRASISLIGASFNGCCSVTCTDVHPSPESHDAGGYDDPQYAMLKAAMTHRKQRVLMKRFLRKAQNLP